MLLMFFGLTKYGSYKTMNVVYWCVTVLHPGRGHSGVTNVLKGDFLHSHITYTHQAKVKLTNFLRSVHDLAK